MFHFYVFSLCELCYQSMSSSGLCRLRDNICKTEIAATFGACTCFFGRPLLGCAASSCVATSMKSMEGFNGRGKFIGSASSSTTKDVAGLNQRRIFSCCRKLGASSARCVVLFVLLPVLQVSASRTFRDFCLWMRLVPLPCRSRWCRCGCHVGKLFDLFAGQVCALVSVF